MTGTRSVTNGAKTKQAQRIMPRITDPVLISVLAVEDEYLISDRHHRYDASPSGQVSVIARTSPPMRRGVFCNQRSAAVDARI